MAAHEVEGKSAAARPAKGYASLPHTADVCIEAWAPTAEECYEEAVAAFVAIFADVTSASDGQTRPFHVGPGSPEMLLLLLLDEVLLTLDVEGLLPCAVQVERLGSGVLDGVFTLVPAGEVDAVGSVAKGVSYQGLSFGAQGGRWMCQATVDV